MRIYFHMRVEHALERDRTRLNMCSTLAFCYVFFILLPISFVFIFVVLCASLFLCLSLVSVLFQLNFSYNSQLAMSRACVRVSLREYAIACDCV